MVETVVNNSDVAFLGEMDDGDQPWLAKFDLEALESRILTEFRHRCGYDSNFGTSL